LMKLNKNTIIMGTLTILLIFSVTFKVFLGGPFSPFFMTEAEKKAWIEQVSEEPFLAYDIMGDGPNPPKHLIEMVNRIGLIMVISVIFLMSGVTVSMVRRDMSSWTIGG